MTNLLNKLIGDRIDLTDSLKDGTIDNLLVVLESGGRIAAVKGVRSGTVTALENAVYSACPVTGADGCPRDPSWKISAVQVSQDSATGRLKFKGGRITILGVTIPLLPIFSIGDGSQKGGVTGALLPNIRVDSNNGVELSMPYYWRVDRNRDLTLTPHVYTGALPAIEARWRHLTDVGAYQVGALREPARPGWQAHQVAQASELLDPPGGTDFVVVAEAVRTEEIHAGDDLHRPGGEAAAVVVVPGERHAPPQGDVRRKVLRPSIQARHFISASFAGNGRNFSIMVEAYWQARSPGKSRCWSASPS